MRAKLITAGALIAWECWAGLAAADNAAAPVSSIGRSGPLVAPASPPRQQRSIEEKENDAAMRPSVSLGGYGGPDMRVTSVLGDPATLLGAQATWIMNHQYFFGVAGYGLATRVDTPEAMRIDGNPSRLGLVYGGLRLGVVATTPHSFLHVTIATLVGPGSLTGISTVPTRAEFETGYERRLGHSETFFVLEPEVAGEASTATFMRVALGASYRYVTGVEHPGLSSANLSGPAVSLAFKFGVF